ncbi:MAG: CooT family nickel-binding protein [Thermodesulfovibrionales bacterium]|nr:CooT family nickel-binding protein [Nitrospinota bacterium]MCG2710611.1 CooT family nickel-binding protein [Thermodesulfovibrionales bacterium]MDP3047891.1 CooT family nickel-binding protein [Thermodesulfovibrionales bacterium]
MCESNAYIEDNGNEILYLEAVDILRPEGGKIYLKNFWGEEKVFKGEIKEISFLKHRIVLRIKSEIMIDKQNDGSHNG